MILVLGTTIMLGGGTLPPEELPEVPFMVTEAKSQSAALPPQVVSATDDGRAFVSADRLWWDTGVSVAKGQTIVLSATGEVKGCQHPNLWASGPWGPAGTVGPDGRKACALIAKIEGAQGRRAFYVGERLSFHAPTSGRFYLGVSDISHGDNSGGFSVDVVLDGRRIDFRSKKEKEPTCRWVWQARQVSVEVERRVTLYQGPYGAATWVLPGLVQKIKEPRLQVEGWLHNDGKTNLAEATLRVRIWKRNPYGMTSPGESGDRLMKEATTTVKDVRPAKSASWVCQFTHREGTADGNVELNQAEGEYITVDLASARWAE
jgi:hypothetical protein